MATFHILNFGCRASQADGAALKQQLLQAGLQEVASVEESAVAILNTCTVTASADAEVRQFVRRIHRRNPQCRILVTGLLCPARAGGDRPDGRRRLGSGKFPQAPGEHHPGPGSAKESGDRAIGRSGEQEESDLSSTSAFPQAASARLVQIQAARNSDEWRVTSEEQASPIHPDHPIARSPDSSDPGLRTSDRLEVFVGEITEEFHFAPVFADDRTRPTLKIQDGCDARCSFCVIPSVRGQSRSLAAGKSAGAGPATGRCRLSGSGAFGDQSGRLRARPRPAHQFPGNGGAHPARDLHRAHPHQLD